MREEGAGATGRGVELKGVTPLKELARPPPARHMHKMGDDVRE